MLPVEGLKHHFTVNFTLLYHHKMDVRIFDDMLPWERDVYLQLMAKEIEEENLKIQMEESARRAGGKRR